MGVNIYVISSLSAFVGSIFLTLFISFNGLREKSRRAIIPIIICTGTWCLFPFLAAMGGLENALLFTRLVYIAAVFTAPFFLNFGLTILELEKNKHEKRLIRLSFIISAFFFLPFLSSPAFIKEVILFQPYFIIKGGAIYLLFILFFGAVCMFCFYKLFQTYKQSQGFKKNQLKYVFLGFFFAFISGLIHFSTSFNIPELFPHDFLVIVCVLVLVYAIVRYRLMDIKVVLTRTGIFIAVYAFLLGIPFALVSWRKPWLSSKIGVNWWMAPLAVMAVLASVAPFVYLYLNRKAEERLFREQKRYQDTLKYASIGMTRIRKVKKLLIFMAHVTARIARLKYACIYLLDNETANYMIEAARAREKQFEALALIEANSPLIKWLLEQKEPLVMGEIQRRLQDRPQKDLGELNGQLGLMNAALVVPSFAGNKLLCFMILGDKLSGEIYTHDDLHVFTVLANQAALAIENARFFEETRQMQEQISQAEKMATIGTMADGLSHQMNNRFHALSLIAGDTLDTIKLADTGGYSPKQKELLIQIKHGLERIHANVLQGSEVVKGILKYSRKGESGFSAVALDKIIDAALEMVQYKIKLSNIDIIREYPKDTSLVYGNLTQLLEVFFNLIDNAYDASMERKDALREEGYRPRIRIYTQEADNGYLKIHIEDNGMGVRTEDLRKMFTPFFTTKASSRKGTGLGLYVIQKIITVNHSGKISVDSHYARGTIFTLELPAANASLRENLFQGV